MSKRPVILALDQSSTCTGWVRGHPDGPVTIGSYRNPKCGADYGRALSHYWDWLGGELDGVDLLAFEKPVRPNILNLHTARLLYSIAGIIEMVCRDHSVRVVEVDNGEHKKLIYGKGGKKPEEFVARRHAKSWGFDATNIDECDASGIFLLTVQHQYPDAFSAWTQRKVAA
jgi:hypothetical protein